MRSILRRIAARLAPRLVRSGGDVSDELRFALNEISELRQWVRMLLAESHAFHAYMAQTAKSFDVQWDLLPQGVHLIGDPVFDRESVARVESYTGFPADWFAGKSVLDAGCGNGRWTHTLARLGARVNAFDVSEAGVAAVARLCAEFPEVSVGCRNLLEPLGLDRQFDFAWCFGVGHYTGDTRRLLQNVSAAVRPDGYLFAMIHGEPRAGKPGDYAELNSYIALRREVSGMSFDERIAFLRSRFGEDLVHAWFNGVSPRINDLHRFDEIRDWLIEWRFTDIIRTFDNRNLFIRARRPPQ